MEGRRRSITVLVATGNGQMVVVEILNIVRCLSRRTKKGRWRQQKSDGRRSEPRKFDQDGVWMGKGGEARSDAGENLASRSRRG